MFTRKLNISRGGREGNNALLEDIDFKEKDSENLISEEILIKVMCFCENTKMFDLLRAEDIDYWDNMLLNLINVPATSGNKILT